MLTSILCSLRALPAFNKRRPFAFESKQRQLAKGNVLALGC